MTEQDFWHLVTIVIFLLSLWRLRKGLIDSTSWFCLFFSISYSGNVLGYPLALLEDPVFIWLKDWPATTLHGQILFVAMVAAWTGHFLVRRKLASSKKFKNLPALPFSDIKLDKAFRFLAFAGALLSIAYALLGYYGYFISREYLQNPTLGMAIVKSLMAITSGLLLLVIVNEFQKQKRLGVRTIILITIWILAGFLSGFKTMVVTPVLFVIIGAWMTGHVRSSHFLLMAFFIVAAYSVVEPMRDVKRQAYVITAYEGMTQVISSEDFSMMDTSIVADRFLQRIDYTRTAVITLMEYERGRLIEFKRRVDEYFLLAPVMAFVPRALWPDKPKANLGGVLSYEVTGNDRNAITPSQIVITYIWGGWVGVILISLIWGMLCTVGGQIIIDNKYSIYRSAPFILLAIILSRGSAVMAAYFIHSIRMVLVLFVLYQIGVLRKTHFPRRHKALKNISIRENE